MVPRASIGTGWSRDMIPCRSRRCALVMSAVFCSTVSILPSAAYTPSFQSGDSMSTFRGGVGCNSHPASRVRSWMVSVSTSRVSTRTDGVSVDTCCLCYISSFIAGVLLRIPRSSSPVEKSIFKKKLWCRRHINLHPSLLVINTHKTERAPYPTNTDGLKAYT